MVIGQESVAWSEEFCRGIWGQDTCTTPEALHDRRHSIMEHRLCFLSSCTAMSRCKARRRRATITMPCHEIPLSVDPQRSGSLHRGRCSGSGSWRHVRLVSRAWRAQGCAWGLVVGLSVVHRSSPVVHRSSRELAGGFAFDARLRAPRESNPRWCDGRGSLRRGRRATANVPLSSADGTSGASGSVGRCGWGWTMTGVV